MTREIIAENVNRLRTAQDLSFEELAERSGVNKDVCKYIEYGLADPRLSNLQGLAKGLGVSIKQIVESPRKLTAVHLCMCREDKPNLLVQV